MGKLLSLFIEHSLIAIPSEANAAKQLEVECIGRMGSLKLLTNDVLNELPHSEKCRGPVALYPTCTLASFGSYYSVVLWNLQKEIGYLFGSSLGKTKDPSVAGKTIEALALQIDLLQTLFTLTRNNDALAKKPYLIQQLKSGSVFVETFVSKVIPFFQTHFQHHEESIFEIIRLLQKCVRQMYHIISYGKREKDANIAKEAPRAKKALEMFIHKVKAMLKKYGCMTAMCK